MTTEKTKRDRYFLCFLSLGYKFKVNNCFNYSDET